MWSPGSLHGPAALNAEPTAAPLILRLRRDTRAVPKEAREAAVE